MPEDKSKFQDLNEKLYSRTRYENPADRRSSLREKEGPEVNESWQGQELDEMLQHEREIPDAHPLIKKFFTLSLIFFAAAAIIATYVFFGGANFISSKNVGISVVGPTTISAGESFELGVTIENKNNADLEITNLSIQYPAGTRQVDDTTKPLNYTQEELGEIRAGREAVRNIKVVLFGSPGEVKEIKFSVEYKVKGSSATFYKDKVYEIFIGEAPIIFSVESPGEVDSGELFTTTLSISLNSTEPLSGLMVRAEYPYGYLVAGATPEAIAGSNVWSLGTLSPGEKKTITLRGELSGENREERTFRFYVGVADSGDNPNFKTIIASALKTIAIARPSIGLNFTLNGDSGQTYIASMDQSVSGSVSYRSYMSDKLLNPRLTVRLTGQALNKSSVTAMNNGFYDSASNAITWNLTSNSGVAELAPGDNGSVSFRFSSQPNISSTLGGREIVLEATLSGTPIGSPGGRPISTSEKRIVRISSEVSLFSEVIYSRGEFTNFGPIPPRAETETTYTVNLRTINTQARVGTAYVQAKLGQNVKWLGSVGDELTYDEGSNTVTWDITELESGASKTGSFQVSLTPSLSQVGVAPTLVSNIVFHGMDSVTGREMTVYNPSLTTRISGDPTYVQGDEYVVK